MPALEDDLKLIAEAAEAAGEIAMSFHGKPVEVREKGGGAGPVTEADLAVDAMLRETLIGARPDYGWLSEESDDDPARLGAERVFIVDPIDGTRSFIAGERSFAVSVGLAERGSMIAGAVRMPARKTTYAAAKGMGAQRNGSAITVRPGAQPVTILAARPNFHDTNWPGGLPRHEQHFRPSLAYRMCLVAEARFDVMLTFRDTWEWDVAAGSLIVAEAGGAVSGGRGEPIGFNTPQACLPGLVAAHPETHAALIALR